MGTPASPSPFRLDQVEFGDISFSSLTAANGRFHFTLQPDRNIVLSEAGRSLWTSNTQKQDASDSPYILKLQMDGNLCAYNKDNVCFWTSHTMFKGQGPYSLILHDDGACTLYDASQTATWSVGPDTPAPEPSLPPTSRPGCPSRVEQVGKESTNITELASEDGRFHLILQPDRNLVLFKNRDVIWSSNSTSSDTSDGPYTLALQGDGNLCGYNARGECFWASKSNDIAYGPYSLTLQDDGNCVLYCNSTKVPVWSTDTWKFS